MKSWKQKVLFTLHYLPFTQKAFTLAEVLITLGIIGVVASITIPILMNNVQEKQFKEAAKKAFSVSAQAVQQMKADNGGTLTGYIGNYKSFKPVFMQYLKVAQDCNWSDCVIRTTTSTKYKSLSGNPADTTYGGEGQFVTTDGMFFNIANFTAQPIIIIVDVNGYGKGPNIYGRDTFAFNLANDQLLPLGSTGTFNENGTTNAWCNKNTHDARQGLGCMALIMQGTDYSY